MRGSLNEEVGEDLRVASDRSNSHLVDSARELADLATRLDRLAAAEAAEAKEIAILAARSTSILIRRLAAIDRRLSRIDGRLRREEYRLGNLSSRISDHETSLRMICEVLKQMDDPYGFGRGLDDRIANEDLDFDNSEPRNDQKTISKDSIYNYTNE